VLGLLRKILFKFVLLSDDFDLLRVV
jgi:hypothetical protein